MLSSAAAGAVDDEASVAGFWPLLALFSSGGGLGGWAEDMVRRTSRWWWWCKATRTNRARRVSPLDAQACNAVRRLLTSLSDRAQPRGCHFEV